MRLLRDPHRLHQMKEWFADHIAAWFYAAFGGLVIWIAKRATAKVDAQESRIALLELQQVKREDLDSLRRSVDEALTRTCARIESRTDEILLHMARRDDR
jgi:hypothetical protein